MENEKLSLGKCCICEAENQTVRNIVTLRKRLPADETRGGWGCFVCNLEPFGAVAVLCDECLDRKVEGRAEIKFACLGYPPENRRIELEKLTEPWRHVTAKHPESWNWVEALEHFRAVRRTYQELAATPGVNTGAALELVFRPLSERFHRGERTHELYEAMLNVE